MENIKKVLKTINKVSKIYCLCYYCPLMIKLIDNNKRIKQTHVADAELYNVLLYLQDCPCIICFKFTAHFFLWTDILTNRLCDCRSKLV